MASVSPRLDCNSLEYWCPMWQECVSCSADKVSIGNHAFWVAGSSASVYTEPVDLYGVTISTVEVNTWIEEGTSAVDVEWSSTLTLIIYCNNQEIYRNTVNVARAAEVVKYKFNVGKKVSGRVVIKYELSHEAWTGWVRRAWSSPVISYIENPPATVARIHVESYPSGASIYIDNKYVGVAPIDCDTAEGYHDITGVLRGYRLRSCGYMITDSSCRVYTRAGEVTSVMLEFEPGASVSYLRVTVTVGGKPVPNANVMVLSKVVKPYPDYYSAKTDSSGVAVLKIPEGNYLVLADNGESFFDYRDDVYVAGDTQVTLSLRDRSEATFALKLYLTVDASQYVAPIVNALASITVPFISAAGSLLSNLGINMPVYELLNHFTVEKVEATGSKEVTIYIKYKGSPVPQAVVILALLFAIAVVVFVIGPIVLKWAFGEIGGTIAFVAVVAAVATILAVAISSR
jgi:hypothetical protein